MKFIDILAILVVVICAVAIIVLLTIAASVIADSLIEFPRP